MHSKGYKDGLHLVNVARTTNEGVGRHLLDVMPDEEVMPFP